MLFTELFNSGSKHITEGVLDNPSAQDSPVASAIIRRILLQRTDLLAKYGPEMVGQAVDEVADFVGDVEEIGSSDVSGWVRYVEQMLGNMEQGVAEGEKKPHPETWHDVDKKLGKAVDKMSQAEKVKKGLAHPDTLKKQGVAEGSATMWEVSFDYGPHMTKTVKVKAGSKQEARAKVEKAAEKSYTRGIMINWVKPVEQGVAEGDISQLEKDIAAAPVKPIASMEADEKIGGRYDADEFDAMVNRLKKLAGAGPMKTVWDPARRQYRNMPTAVQPAQQPKK